MPILDTVASLAALEIERGFGPITRRLNHARHRRTLQQGSVERGAASQSAPDWSDGEPVWFKAGTPPRRQNRLTPLLDGAAYFTSLTREIERAQSYVFIVCWCLTPQIPLLRDDPATLENSKLLSVLLEAAGRVPVRILLWSGAPVLIQPTARSVREVRRAIQTAADHAGVDLFIQLDETAHPSHCHHQKTVVIDGQTAFVGGMDITTFQGDRWDLPGHPLRAGLNWHDVQTKIEGEAVADVETNFRQRWAETSPRSLPRTQAPSLDDTMQTPAQIVRTVPARTYKFAPNGEFGIHHSLIELFRSAKSLIYIENQYLWSPDVVDALKAAIEGPNAAALRIVIVLPAHAYSGKWDNDRRVDALRKSDKNQGVFEAYSLYASGPHLGVQPFRYRPVYVHAKVTIVDDEWLSIGSANLNTRGLVTDGELNVVAHDPELAKRVRAALWSEHLGMPAEAVAESDAHALIDGVWKSRAAQNAAIIQRADGLLNGNVHRYELGRMPGRFLLEEIESLTFEH